MADNEKLSESMRSNTDWEVVSYSAYAAVPNKSENINISSQEEPSLSESGQFLFPPSEHENLPINTSNEINQKTKDQETVPDEYEGRRRDGNVEEREDGLKEEEKKGEEEDGLEWVKKKGMWIYRRVKEANAVWSVVVAAAIVGLVILGQRWQREKSNNQYRLK